MAGGERSEAPTPRRRAEARRRGEVAKSAEISAALGILAGFGLLQVTGARAFAELGDFMRSVYRYRPAGDLQPEQLTELAVQAAAVAAKTVGPIALGMMVCGVVASMLQTGVLFSTYALRPNFRRLNPLRGLSRMVSARAWFDLAKALAKVSLCGFVLYQIAVERTEALLSLAGADLRASLSVLAEVAVEMGLKIGGLLAVAAILDYTYQRFQYEKGLRMSRQELKEEMRMSEGDPHLRSRQRGQQRALIRQRMMHAVPRADVLVTNPTHLAIALKYEPQAMVAPRIVAKGQRLMAERIIAVAKAHNVPIVRNVPLAHALYRAAEIGDEVPASLYKAVAEVLAFVYRLREARRAGIAG